MGSLNEVSKGERDGARMYSQALLFIYDAWVLGLNNRFVWRCRTKNLLRMYNEQMTDHHLDIGPGTGFHLRHARWPSGDRPQRVALLDLNASSLAMASRRLGERGISPTIYEGSILHELPVECRYGSVATNLVMHCVPGSWESKGVAFGHVADAVADDGVFFGSTVLASGVPHTWLSRATQGAFQRIRAFHNAADDFEGLQRALDTSFAAVQLWTVGSMALWTARRPRRAAVASPDTAED